MAKTKTTKTTREYNPIYELLVPDRYDIKGLCSYAIYKSDKIEKIKEYKEKHGNKEPTDDFFNNYHKKAKNQLSKYKLDGTRLYEVMKNAIIADGVISQLGTQNQKDDKNSFWQKVWSSVVARLIWMALPFILILIGLLVTPKLTVKIIRLVRPEVFEEVIKTQTNTETISYFDALNKPEMSSSTLRITV